MLRSEGRILTTHAGSLPRSPELIALLVQQSRGEHPDPAALDEAIERSTRRVVEQQLAAGIDVGSDGEQSRESFFTYVQHRMTGFGGSAARPAFKDWAAFPSFLQVHMGRYTDRPRVNLIHPPKAVGAVHYADTGPMERESALFQRVLAEQPRPFAETFMTAPSPGIIGAAMTNEHYPSLETYIDALAEALRTEYEYIVAQGHVLQLDCPDLAMERHVYFAERPLADFLTFVEITIATMNRALLNVPRDRVRLHVCWGNYGGPHVFDVPLDDILPLLYQANVGALLLSQANPRHAHEYRSFERLPLPAEMSLIIGTIDTTTNYVEHPEVVADRLERVALAVGDPERIVAGTDCGFDTAAGAQMVAEELVWEKLKALSEGAAIAGRRLFGAAITR